MTKEQPNVEAAAWYSVSDAATLLGISRSTLYDAIRRGPGQGGIQGVPRRTNGKLKISGREILRYWKG